MVEELVGYEQDRPWMDALFPGNTVPARYCLECYTPQPGVNPAKPLTRQTVEAEIQALHEAGTTDNGWTVFWRGLKEEQCWNCGKYLLTGKSAPKRKIDALAAARRLPYQLRHILVQHPEYLTNNYPTMTETERLEVVAYVTRQQRTKRSYHDMGTEDRLAAVEDLLQQWRDLADQIDASFECLLPEQAVTKLAKLANTSRLYLHETQGKELYRNPRRFKVAHEHPLPLTTEYLSRLEQVARGVVDMEIARPEGAPCPFCGAPEVSEPDGGSSQEHEVGCLGTLAFDVAEDGGLIDDLLVKR